MNAYSKVTHADCASRFDYELCAELTHTKQGYQLQSQETDAANRHKYHALLNRMVALFPPMEKGNRLILAALDGVAYMCIQEPPDRPEARRTSKLRLYAFSANNSPQWEASPVITAECGRMMQRICREKTAVSECYCYTDLTLLISAFILTARIMPQCIEQRMIFNTKATADAAEEQEAVGDAIPRDITGMELFSIFLSDLCRSSGLSQAKINQAASLSAEISRKTTFRYQDLLDFHGNPQILADTADQIHQRVPSAYPYIAMVCVAKGYPCETLSGACLPEAFADDLAETYIKASTSALSAICIEHLLLLPSSVTLSEATMAKIRQFIEQPHREAEPAIRAILLDKLLGLQYDLDLIVLDHQRLCKTLLSQMIFDSDSRARPALEWLAQKTQAYLTGEAWASASAHVLDKGIAARLFYLRIPCVPAKKRPRPLNDKELMQLCGGSGSAVYRLTELMELGWNPVRGLHDSKLYRKAVRQRAAATQKKLRTELCASLQNCCRLFRALLASYFHE